MKLIFNEEKHTYTDEQGNLIPSVSEIIRNWLGDKYFDINKEVLKKAQEKGNKVHKEVEDYLLQNIEPATPTYEFAEFKKIWNNEFKVAFTEQVICGATEYGMYAGTYDLLDTVNGIIADIKTNYTLDEDYVRIQLSLYAMALRQNDVKITKGYVIHLPSEKSPQKPQIKALELLPEDVCENIVRAYFAGETKPEDKLQCLNEQAVKQLELSLSAIERIELEIKSYKEMILKEMEERQINQIKVGNITISYIAPTTRESIDSRKFKAELPELAKRYTKKSDVKSQVRISVKEAI